MEKPFGLNVVKSDVPYLIEFISSLDFGDFEVIRNENAVSVVYKKNGIELSWYRDAQGEIRWINFYASVNSIKYRICFLGYQEVMSLLQEITTGLTLYNKSKVSLSELLSLAKSTHPN